MSDDPPVQNSQLSVVRGTSKLGGLQSAAAGPTALARAEDGADRRVSTVPNFWRIAHNAIRGHYALILGLSVLSSAAVATLAWRAMPLPTYPSKGVMRIAYTLPVVRVATDQTEAMPMYESYMQLQKTLITSRRVVDAAIHDRIWADTKQEIPADPKELYFAKHLTVDVKPRNELIEIVVNDKNAQTAAAAVTAIINAYESLYNSQDTQLDKQRLGLLEGQQKDLQGQLNKINDDIRARAKPYGTTQLDEQFLNLQNKQTQVERALNDVEITLAELGRVPTNASAPARLANVGPNDLTVEQIAALDPKVRYHLDLQGEKQEEVDRLTKYGLGKAHPKVMAAVRDLELEQARTQKFADDFRKARVASAGAVPYEPRAITEPPGQSPEELKIKEANLRTLSNNIKAQMDEVGNARMDIQAMQTKQKTLNEALAGVTQRIGELQQGGALGGRLSIISKGEVSLLSTPDHRQVAAAAGGVIGLFLPVLGAIGLSLFRRRYRFSDEPATDYVTSRAPLLGMLPNVPAHGSAPQLRMAAAYAAHHLRVLLSSRATTVVKRTFLVTSAGDGEGKTTVTMALAISFAAAKHRTLVIDGDFVGRRITRGFNAEQQEGLFESMGHGDMDGQWLNAAANLCILPTGKVDAADACGITAENVRLLLEQAIQHFDVVLIDTGSILGSPESAVLAREVDGVIVTIARGQPQGQVRRALLRLEALGAMVVGTIFNRADLADFQSSYVTPTAGWDEPGRPEPTMETELQQRVANFGPLVRAVAAAVPTESHQEGARV